MITISLLNYTTGLPLEGRAIQLIFTDTIFGWIRPRLTDKGGATQIHSSPGLARVYVEGELHGEYLLQEKLELYLKEAEASEPSVEIHDLIRARTQEHRPVEKQAVPASLLALEAEQEVRA